jgi:hypothetical protein
MQEEEALVMLHKITAIFLSFLIILNTAFAQPAAESVSVDDFTLTVDATFEPAPFPSQIGDLKLNVFYMLEGVCAHEPGVLVVKDDYSKIEFILNRQNVWCEERLQKERDLFDKKLRQCQEDCKDLNKELRQKIDTLNEKIKLLDDKSKLLEEKILWWQIGGISATAILSGFLIYKSVK